MTLQESVENIFDQLEHSILGLSDEQYAQKIETLFGASIGEHVRHVIELFICLQEGYEHGTVNYENRKRDVTIQTSRHKAIEIMRRIRQSFFEKNKELILLAGYCEHTNEVLSFATNYYRELAYNIEHSIHHMALIRIGISEVSDLTVPEGYGVAPSTIKYRRKLRGG